MIEPWDVSHAIGTPLTVIANALFLIERQIQRSEDGVLWPLKGVHEEALQAFERATEALRSVRRGHWRPVDASSSSDGSVWANWEAAGRRPGGHASFLRGATDGELVSMLTMLGHGPGREGVRALVAEALLARWRQGPLKPVRGAPVREAVAASRRLCTEGRRRALHSRGLVARHRRDE